MHLRCPHCQNAIELADLPSSGEVTCTGCGSSFNFDPHATRSEVATVRRLGKFEIITLLGEGAFGSVFKARDTELDRVVAIKIPRAGNVGSGPQDVDRFLREARAVAQLRFPSIISLHEVGLDNGTTYLVCDFVEGITLADHLTGRGFTFTESAKLLAEVADALQYAHSLGVVHRDVKPSNIMIRPDGSPCVMDFGLAKRDAGEITMTIDGQILGTPAYMSPEQARGEGHKVDGKSDVYSLGVMLYQLLTGELPFRGNARMLLHQVLHDEPRSPRSLNDKIPRDLETIALKAMAKEPGRRFSSAKALAEDLRRWLAGEPILARPVASVEQLWRWCKRNPALASLTGALVVAIVISFAVGAWQLRQTTRALSLADKRREERALAQISALCDAAPSAVPRILIELDGNRETVLVALRERHAEEAIRAKKMRLSLAILHIGPDQVRDELAAWMLETPEPTESLLIRDQLRPHAKGLVEPLWQQVGNDALPPSKRFRALSALAQFDAGDERWQAHAAEVVEEMFKANPLHLGSWIDAFRPVRSSLLPVLREVYLGKRLAEQKHVAATVLADYVGDDLLQIADLIMDADATQFNIIFPRFEQHGKACMAILHGQIDKQGPVGAEKHEGAKEAQAKRQANAAVALLRMNQPDRVWPLLKHRPDPRVRSYLVHWMAPRGVSGGAVVRWLDHESDVTIRRALILSLGVYGDNAFLVEDRAALISKLQGIYSSDNDAGLHAASEWIMRQWKQDRWIQEVNDRWANDKEGQRKRINRIQTELTRVALPSDQIPVSAWYVNSLGQTMVVIPAPVEFMMGSPVTEHGRFDLEKQHKKRIGRAFAIAANLVTLKQYRDFRAVSGNLELPLLDIDWYHAAEYCNWLSKQDAIPEEQWCYETKGKEFKLRPNYLSLTGYRLPTEAEMEYATRAKATTARFFGESEELLSNYAWYNKNSQEKTWPVGSLKPNDFGLFDVHGTAYVWCQETMKAYPTNDVSEDIEDDNLTVIKDTASTRALRGGSYNSPARQVRSAYRLNNLPWVRGFPYGFRPARTLTVASAPSSSRKVEK